MVRNAGSRRTPGRLPSTLTPLSADPNIGQHLSVVSHPNPLRDIRMGEPLPPHCLSPVSALHPPPALIPKPAPPLRPKPTPPPNNRLGALDPRDVGSIPKPTNLGNVHLREAMGLDGTKEARMYYNRIRVSALMMPPHLLTRGFPRMLSVDTWATALG